MNKSYAVGLLLLSMVLLAGTGIVGRILYFSDDEMDVSSEWVSHTYEVISEIEKLSALAEGMVANQRGFLLTGDDTFQAKYDANKTDFLESSVRIVEWTKDNPDQVKRFVVHHDEFETFSATLEANTEKYKDKVAKTDAKPDPDFATTILSIADHKARILQLNDEALASERTLLKQRIEILDAKKRQYLQLLLAGAAGVALLVFLFNAGLLYNQSRRFSAEQSLKDSEERFALALEGTNDGIFDWNLKTDKIFFSKQFYKMLGQDREAFVGTINDFKALLHPDDDIKVWQYMERYLHREIADYSNTFRMQHSNGSWIWVQSRAKATYDSTGTPVRVVGSNADITFVKEYQENLKNEKLAAEKASRAKSDFLAHMSHEIRTPLTAISGIAEIFQRHQSNLDDKQRQLIKTLYLSTATLKDLVNDVLDFSKIESGELELTFEDFYLIELFEQVVSIMSVNAREKGINFTLDYQAVRDVAFSGDRLRMRQVLINLIGNAIKFTEKGSVIVSVMREEIDGMAQMKIRIADSGIGIAKENHDMIFERFKQADSSDSRKYQGTGLGLPISSRLVKLMGGSITLESDLGKGSIFTVILPLRQVGSLPEDGNDQVLNKKLSDRIKASVSGEDRLLLVEDYEGNIVVLSYILDELGYAYDIARTGLEALNLWKERHYDIVLMDIQMPEMDGFTATANMRAIEREKMLDPTTIIGMTAHALVGDKDKCIEAGMDAYLAKPIAEAELKTIILEYLKRKHNKAA